MTQSGAGAIVADPVDLATRKPFRHEVDMVLKTKFGVPIVVDRLYDAAEYRGVSAADLMFDEGWWYRWETRVTVLGGNPAYSYWISPEGQEVYLQSTNSPTNTVFETDLSQYSPARLTESGGKYIVDTAAGERFTYDSGGKIEKYEANRFTAGIDDHLTFDHDSGTGKLLRIHAPDTDDRYVEFTYDGTTGNVSKATLKGTLNGSSPSTFASDFVFYTYNVDGYLATTRYSQSTEDNYIQYTYGSSQHGEYPAPFDEYLDSHADASGHRFLERTGWFYSLALVEHFRTDNTGNEMVLKYRMSGHEENPDEGEVEAIYSYDPDETTNKWQLTHEIDDDEIDFVYNLGGDPATTTAIVQAGNYILTDMEYTGAAAQHIETRTDLISGTLLYHKQVANPGMSEVPLWERTYDTSSGEHLSKYNLLTEKRYTDGTNYDQTTIFYGTSYTNFPGIITNYYGQGIGITYGTYTSGDVDEGRVVSLDYSSGNFKDFVYYDSGSEEGLLETITTPNGVTTFEYDDTDEDANRGLPSKITLPDGNFVEYTYNDWGLPLTETWRHLDPTEYTYSDSFSTGNSNYYMPPRLVSVENGLAEVTAYTYNGNRRVSTVEPQNGDDYTITYDARGRMESRTNAESETESFIYDALDRLIEFSDGRGLETAYKYDHFGRVTKITDADGEITEFAYVDEGTSDYSAAASSIAYKKDQAGRYHHVTYDYQGKPIEKYYLSSSTLTGSPVIEIEYDRASRVTSISDSRVDIGNDTYTYAYDSIKGYLNKVTHPDDGGYWHEYFRDAYGRVIAYRDVDGNITEYSLTGGGGRIDEIQDAYGGITSFTYPDAMDTTSPYSAPKQITYSNDAVQRFEFDSLGRMTEIAADNSSAAEIDYIQLAYDNVGRIEDMWRKDGGDYYHQTYNYDQANRLILSRFRTSGATTKSNRAYAYDDAGNRTIMEQDNDATSPVTTAYTYGDRNQMSSNDGYLAVGSADTGNMDFTYDDKGNMTGREWDDGISREHQYAWDDDNRMYQVVKIDTDGMDVTSTNVEYNYNAWGQRVLKRGPWATYDYSPVILRERSFFKGLTEEVKKQSVSGAHANSAFGRTLKLDGSEGTPTGWSDPYVNIVADADRRSDVYEFTSWSSHGTGFWVASPDNGWNITGKKTFSCWAKATTYASEVSLYIETNSARRAIQYRASTGAPFVIGNILYIQLGGTDQDYLDKWTRIERNIEADLKTQWPSESLVRVLGCAAWTGNSSYPMYMDDLSFSNSMTTEHNTLSPGVIGHILRNRSTNPSTYAVSDRWFHYNQVGTVMCETDDTGALAQTHHFDAFGSTLDTWQNGLNGGDSGGWHHNTKEFDDDIGLVYMYQRWYSPELGIFMSSAPWQPMFEHRYGFALQMPQMFVDPFGTLWRQIGGIVGKVWTLPNTVVGTTIGLVGTGYGYIDGNPEDPTISFGNNAIQFEKNPFANRPYTLGNATIYSSDQGPDTPTERYDDVPADPNATVGDHERGHTRQYEVLGPLTGPIYLLGGSGAMERAADDYADTGVWSLF